MPRGGTQRPKKPAPVSGPGSLSKRTDGKQPVRSEGLDNPDMQYGDVKKLEAAQGAAPLPEAPPTHGMLSGGAPGGAQRGQIRNDGKLPSWLLGMPSARPTEPATTGLPMGPGEGPDALITQQPQDQRESILMDLAYSYGNEDARRMLMDLRQQRAETEQQPGNDVPFGGPLGG